LKSIYSSPFRVYLLLGALALAGIYSGMKLPVSLFPNSSKPKIDIRFPYAGSTAEAFKSTYGNDFEDQFANLQTDTLEVEKIEATYKSHEVEYDVFFKWGASPTEALNEIQNKVAALASRLPDESRDGMRLWLDAENNGFFAASYFSDTRGLDELYDMLEPIISSRLAKVNDANMIDLWNPVQKEIRIELIPEAVAALQLFPRHIEKALGNTLVSASGGSITVGTKRLTVQMPRQTDTLEQLGEVAIPTPGGKTVHLADIAQIDYGPKTSGLRSFRTNGAPSLIVFALPKPGGNVKRMSENIIEIMEQIQPTLPKDVHYKILVDPSEFIRASVNNVLTEVFLAAFIAVLILFAFIGSVRNVATAAIEIPLSMVLAFIMMRLFNMNLNLISLGGLALSAGMNVDASVVVMENIFRHFENVKGKLNYIQRLELITQAVKEVRFPVIASTIASLVVFIPLTFTSDLTYAILRLMPNAKEPNEVFGDLELKRYGVKATVQGITLD